MNMSLDLSKILEQRALEQKGKQLYRVSKSRSPRKTPSPMKAKLKSKIDVDKQILQAANNVLSKTAAPEKPGAASNALLKKALQLRRSSKDNANQSEVLNQIKKTSVKNVSQLLNNLQES